jgi:transposase-like protein
VLAGASTEEQMACPDGLLAELTKRLLERTMEVELTDHRVKVGRDLISRVTDAVMDDVREWAKRPLETSSRSCFWTAWF